MKKLHLPASIRFVVVAIGLILAGAGCEKSTAKKEAPPVQTRKPASPSPSVSVSAEKNSFQDVARHLDAGGNFYLYLGTERWLDGVSAKVSDWRQLVLSIPDIKGEDRGQVTKAFDVVTSLIKNSGLEEISGVGMSSIAREKGLYHTKFIVHHYKGRNTGYLWSVFGRSSHALNGLDFLPETTALAGFSDLDLALVWSVIQKEAGQLGIPEAQEFIRKLPVQFEQMAGLKFTDLLASLGGEYGLALTLDESRKTPLPLPTKTPVEIPEPGLLLVVKVKNDLLFERIDRDLQKNKDVISVNKDGLRMRTMPLALPLPLPLRPTLARIGDYLILATSDTLVQQMVAIKAGQQKGLKSTAEFQKLAQGIPPQGNSFNYMSQRFGRAINEIQKAALEMGAQSGSMPTAWMQGFVGAGQPMSNYSVAANTDEGWLTAGNGSQDGSAVVLVPAVAVAGMLAAIAVPNFVKAREAAQKNACINNLRQISGATEQWALENKKRAGDMPTDEDLFGQSKYIRRKPVCPAGGSYRLAVVDGKPTCSARGHALP